MNILSLDIGLRRTGVAFVDASTGVPIALDTIKHKDFEQLLKSILSIKEDKQVEHIVLGLPLLFSGEEGSQCSHVREFAKLLTNSNIPFSTVDERYTSFAEKEVDKDASAAVLILQTYLDSTVK